MTRFGDDGNITTDMDEIYYKRSIYNKWLRQLRSCHSQSYGFATFKVEASLFFFGFQVLRCRSSHLYPEQYSVQVTELRTVCVFLYTLYGRFSPLKSDHRRGSTMTGAHERKQEDGEANINMEYIQWAKAEKHKWQQGSKKQTWTLENKIEQHQEQTTQDSSVGFCFLSQ